MQRPFANFYGIGFILYELSTPFLNLHWFMKQCNMTGTPLQVANGLFLLIVFFGCRLVWGTYLSVNIYKDLFSVYSSPTVPTLEHTLPFIPTNLEITMMHHTNHLPLWLLLVYLGSNTLLIGLNFFWFGLMLKALVKQVSHSPSAGPKDVKQEDHTSEIHTEKVHLRHETGKTHTRHH